MEARSALRQIAREALGLLLPKHRFAIRGRARDGAIYLTFDDGPHPEHTPRVLDVLASVGACATFFVVGQHAEKHSDLVRRMVREGHAVGNHTWSHCDPRTVTSRELLAEADRTRILIQELTGASGSLFRPPHGKLTAMQLLALMRNGYTVTLWNIDPKDYNCTSADEVQARLADWEPTAGDIVLMHDRLPHAAEAARAVVGISRSKTPSLVADNLQALFCRNVHAPGSKPATPANTTA